MWYAKASGKTTTWNTRKQAEQWIARQVVELHEELGFKTKVYMLWSTDRTHNTHIAASMTLSRARRLLGLL
jgi:hypothetical protein